MDRLLTSIDLFKQPVIRLDNNYYIIAINQSAADLFGWRSIEVVKKSIVNLFKQININFPIQQYVNLPSNSNIHEAVIEICLPQLNDRQQKIIAWQITSIPDNGGYLLVGSDITFYKNLQELNENQQSYLDFVVGNIPCYIYWKDRNSIYLGCNEKFARAAGCHSPAEVIGKSDYELAWGKTEADLFRRGDLEVLNGNAKIDFEEPQLMANGRYAIVLANKVPIKNKENKIIGVLGIYLDITERKQTEEEIKQAKLRAEAFGQIAVQAAHDIRSPLAALEAMLQSLKNLPETQRVLIRNAVERIKDIANNLLIQHKAKEKLFNAGLQPVSVNTNYSHIPVLLILESIISEKRTQYKSKAIRFAIESDKTAYSLFACIKQHQFKRLLSNLIDNAVEAIEAKGNVVLKLVADGKKVMLSVCDDGNGIPSEILPKVFQSDFSFGKQNGSGLGLAYAKQCVEEWGGQISIDSTVGQGTQVIMELTLSPPPAWYPREMIINNNTTVVILDDDKSGHDMWTQRFGDLADSGLEIPILHFYNTKDIVKWYEKNRNNKTLFLVDYELMNDTNTGLDIIEKYNIQNQAILVTSHFENADLQKRCAELNLRLFPKMLAYYIPIRVVKPNLDLIYLDDDPDITNSWQWLAESVGKNILTFNYANELMMVIDNYDKNIPIYIDSELGANNMKGEELARILYEKGYQNIYLATGHSQDYFGEIPWVKGILGKTPDILLEK